MILELHITGLATVNRQLELLAQAMPRETALALRAEAEIEMTEAKRRTPVDTGALRDSGIVEGPDARGEVRMSFGGPTALSPSGAGYAIYVHENLEVWHDVGQAKFLESAVLEAVPYLAERVAVRAYALLEETMS